MQREEVECAICMGDITFIAAPLASGAPMNPGQCAAARRHRTVLLSCSHVYHDKCIHSFEKFSPNEVWVHVSRGPCYDILYYILKM